MKRARIALGVFALLVPAGTALLLAVGSTGSHGTRSAAPLKKAADPDASSSSSPAHTRLRVRRRAKCTRPRPRTGEFRSCCFGRR